MYDNITGLGGIYSLELDIKLISFGGKTKLEQYIWFEWGKHLQFEVDLRPFGPVPSDANTY